MIPDMLKDKTFVLEYSPNCPSPYLVRLNGGEHGVATIDKLPVDRTKDALGYGRTFETAARAALATQGALKLKRVQLARK